jgi:hypothetical protein
VLILRELYNLTPKDRDIILTWRVIHAPKVLDCSEIRKYLPCYSEEEVKNAIKTFNSNMRAKLEADSVRHLLRRLVKEFYLTDNYEPDT